MITAIRLLTFRLTREEFLHFNYRHLAFGIACTWLVGIGRWWDDPGAHLLQHLGIGSIVYIFLLALLLWLIVWPLKPQNLHRLIGMVADEEVSGKRSGTAALRFLKKPVGLF
ncbi:MAG TPA: hypothetical protein VNO50_18050 [Pyrinomonadaceae bacterium]|nr:hypothetical protein [Pyrinomonadaceae bacterium]